MATKWTLAEALNGKQRMMETSSKNIPRVGPEDRESHTAAGGLPYEYGEGDHARETRPRQGNGHEYGNQTREERVAADRSYIARDGKRDYVAEKEAATGAIDEAETAEVFADDGARALLEMIEQQQVSEDGFFVRRESLARTPPSKGKEEEGPQDGTSQKRKAEGSPLKEDEPIEETDKAIEELRRLIGRAVDFTNSKEGKNVNKTIKEMIKGMDRNARKVIKVRKDESNRKRNKNAKTLEGNGHEVKKQDKKKNTATEVQGYMDSLQGRYEQLEARIKVLEETTERQTETIEQERKRYRELREKYEKEKEKKRERADPSRDEETVLIENLKGSLDNLKKDHEALRSKYEKLERRYLKERVGWLENEVRIHTKEEIEEIMERPKTLDNFLRLVAAEWPKEVRDKIKISDLSPYAWGKEYDIAFYVENDHKMDKEIARKLKKEIPELELLTPTEASDTGEYLHLIKEMKIPSRNLQCGEHYGKLINTAKGTEKLIGVFGAMNGLREVCIRDKRRKVLIAVCDSCEDKELVRKAAIYLLGEEVQVEMTAPREVRNGEDGDSATEEEDVADGSGSKRRRRRRSTRGKPPKRSEAVLITLGSSETYADVLREMRASEIDAGVRIQGITKTREGNMLMQVERGQGKAEALRKKLSEKMTGRQLKTLQETRILEVRDLDAITTQQEVALAIKKTHPEVEATVRRMTKTDREQQIAQVVVERRAAEQIIEGGYLRVGWTMCRVREKTRNEGCYKCWEHGHVSIQCKGVDRREMCFNCGSREHRLRDCRNRPCCALCEGQEEGKGVGHRPNSDECRYKPDSAAQKYEREGCYRCGQKSHWARDCKSQTEAAEAVRESCDKPKEGHHQPCQQSDST
ncbi:hepatoma-derived growth factor-related protein 2-like [Photinus pyralis]|uniref:hepatoma-derived growth factor-related protein 2-like n=1 Tax=Photinus pyralis TaxID=7054 RepID=UPI001266F872|nr:hepatoma-derived growth factor-related protein 2-like [Photinus pyralis]